MVWNDCSPLLLLLVNSGAFQTGGSGAETGERRVTEMRGQSFELLPASARRSRAAPPDGEAGAPEPSLTTNSQLTLAGAGPAGEVSPAMWPPAGV